MSDAGIDLTPQAREQLGRAALDWALRYFTEQSELPVYPTISASELTARLSGPLPTDPQVVADVMADFDEVARYGRHNGHPRMFGYVQSSGSFAGVDRRSARLGDQPERHVMAIRAGGHHHRAPGDRVAEDDGRLRSQGRRACC